MRRLSATVENQGAVIRGIELTTTTRVTELRKDIDNAFEEIRNIKDEQKSMNDSQKLKWRELIKEHEEEQQATAKRWEDQAKVNQGISTLTKLLWAILTIVLSIGLGFAWELLKNGGIQGLLR
jgi:hypothetical protein